MQKCASHQRTNVHFSREMLCNSQAHPSHRQGMFHTDILPCCLNVFSDRIPGDDRISWPYKLIKYSKSSSSSIFLAVFVKFRHRYHPLHLPPHLPLISGARFLRYCHLVYYPTYYLCVLSCVLSSSDYIHLTEKLQFYKEKAIFFPDSM